MEEHFVTVITAVDNTNLLNRLQLQPLEFLCDDLSTKEDLIAEATATEAEYAIVYVNILQPQIKSSIKALFQANPDITYIMIVQSGKDKLPMVKIFDDYGIRYVEDGRADLDKIIMKKILEVEAEKKRASESFDESEYDDFPATEEESPKIKKPKRLAIHLPPLAVKPKRKAERTESFIPPDTPFKSAAGSAKPPNTVVIPVFGGNHGAGCTWLCVQLASYLTAQGQQTAVCGRSELNRIFGESRQTDGLGFRYREIDFYGNTDLVQLLSQDAKKYDYILMDGGVPIEFDSDGLAEVISAPEVLSEIKRAPMSVMVSDVSAWNSCIIEQIMTNRSFALLRNTTIFVTPMRTSKKDVEACEQRYGMKLHRMPTCQLFDEDEACNSFICGLFEEQEERMRT